MAFENAPNAVLALGRVETSGVKLLGTCFALGGTYFATTRHVAGTTDENLILVMPRASNLLEYQDTSNTQINHTPARIHAVDPVRDVCVVSIDGGVSVGYRLGSSDEAPPGSAVVTLGFPHANYGRLVLTRQDSQVGARVLIESSGVKSKHIVLNTQARPGQSGSPLFDPSGSKVLGMIIGSYAPGGGGGISLGGVDPHTLHQTTHAISAEYIAPMLGS